MPHRRQVLPQYLDSAAFARLMACLDGSSPRGLRDRAIILCVARLGLRAGEVVGLGLGDIDRRNATVRCVLARPVTVRCCRCPAIWGKPCRSI